MAQISRTVLLFQERGRLCAAINPRAEPQRGGDTEEGEQEREAFLYLFLGKGFEKVSVQNKKLNDV